MRALTIWQPWGDGIVQGWKPLENRDWPPPKSAVGEWIAIHAGKHLDVEGEPGFREMLAEAHPDVKPPAFRSLPLGAIIGVAHLVGCVEDSDSPWFVGDFGWLFSEAVAVEPLPCKGMQGLWTVPEDLVPELRIRFAAARARKPAPRQHVAYVCKKADHEGRHCQICDGSLFSCDVCGSAEGATTSECPGRRMTGDELKYVYEGLLDFKGGTWVADPEIEPVDVAPRIALELSTASGFSLEPRGDAASDYADTVNESDDYRDPDDVPDGYDGDGL